MISLKRSVNMFLLLIAAAPLIAAAGNVRIEHHEPLADLVLTSDATGMQKPGAQSVTGMRFNAFSRQFDIELQPNYALLETIERHNMAGGLQVFRGTVSGSPDSWVRVVLSNGVPRGLLFDGSEMYAIEPVGANTTNTRIFRLADVLIEPGAMTCAAASGAKSAAELYKVVAGEASGVNSQGPGATSQIDIGIVADFEFTSDKGGAVQTEIATRMSNIDGIFSSQLGVQMTVSRVDTFADPDDPFSDVSDAGLLLNDLVDYRSSTPGQRASGLTHLFTGRDLDGSTVGIAYLGALCFSVGAGLTQGTHSVTLDSLIAAHELGHNFGAEHDGTEGSACVSTPQDFLMAPRLNNSDQFSACSIATMQDRIDRAPCITALPSTDIRVVAGPQPGNLLLGDSANLAFDVNSTGTEEATGVALDVTIPAGLTVDDVTTTAGSCMTGAGTVSCSIGALAGGSGATVTLAVTAAAVGSRNVDATGSADVDANSNNNAASFSVSVDPAVDLVTTAQGSVQVQVNQSTTLRPRIENRSSLAASNVSVTITPSAGLRLDSGSWSAGSCAVVNDALECATASLAPNASSTISVQATGVAEGSQSYAITANADETDRDISNNEDSGQVNVGNQPPPGSGEEDSGGGSLGLGSLFMLLGLAAIRRRAARRRVSAA